MPAYPPPAERDAADAEYLNYLLEWNTRPAFIRGLPRETEN
jgi:hypothetical protein